MSRRRRRNPSIPVLPLLGVAAVGLWFWMKSKSSGLPAGVRPQTDAAGNFVMGQDSAFGLPVGSQGKFNVAPGQTLDTQGIPLGAKLSDGSTWLGVVVADTSSGAYAVKDPYSM